ncbi:MAG: HAD family phosphatase [Calditrichaceae bacterium]|nr:HAD family phosphatase [Calditrichaceae bacterium]
MTDIKKLIRNWNPIKAVILDMDGVLVDSEPYHVQSFKIMMDELKLDYDDRVVHSFIGHSIEANIQAINEQFMRGRELNLKEAVDYRDEIYLNLIKQSDLKPLPGVFEFIETCRNKNIRLALASSSIREQVDVIINKLSGHGWNLSSIFSSIVSGDDVVNRKPDPEIYTRTIQNLGLSAKQCLAIEDSPAGVQSAKSAGLYCIGLKSIFINPDELNDADLLINDINQIVNIFN